MRCGILLKYIYRRIDNFQNIMLNFNLINVFYFEDERGSIVSRKFVFTLTPFAQYVYAFSDSQLKKGSMPNKGILSRNKVL